MEESSPKRSFCCAHYAAKYLPLTENWIYKILINHRRYRPVFLSRKKMNLNLFPIDELFVLDDLGSIRKYAEILFFRVSGYFIFFYNVCRKYRVDILHVHFGYHGVKFTGLRRKLAVPMVCSFYGDDAFAYPCTPARVRGYRNLFRIADRILVLGPYMKNALVNLGCPVNKIMIHHLGIDTDKITFSKRIVRKGENIRFLITSSFLEKKGVDLAVKALSAFRNAPFSVDIIGDGVLREKIVDEIRKGGIEDKVTLHGYKPYDYFINLAYRCDVFIQASRTTRRNNKEGTPMAIVDAMATGMAIIATRHSDIPEVVIDGENGYLAEENDLHSLINCIEKTFAFPERIEHMSIKCRERVDSEFNSRIQTEKLEAMYTSLIQAERT